MTFKLSPLGLSLDTHAIPVHQYMPETIKNAMQVAFFPHKTAENNALQRQREDALTPHNGLSN